MKGNEHKIRFYSPLRYPGGKSVLYPFVSSLILNNKQSNSIYAEPYAGGCGLALKLLFRGVVDEIFLNDYDYFIFSFWNTILNNSIEFCNWISELEVNIENWHFYKKVLNNATEYNQKEIAKATFFLNRCNISGVIKGGVIGGKQQTGKYKLDSRFNKTTLINRIELIASKKGSIHFSNLDAIDFLKQINSKRNILIYLDPPYFKKGSQLYLNFYQKEDHIALYEYLLTCNPDFILSYDNNEFIKELYDRYNRYRFNISQSTSNKVGNEVIIFSDRLDYESSLPLLKSPLKINSMIKNASL